MTWIVGMPTIFGYSVGISDIRVTLADGSERDCLQKIYPIGQSIALGFAGSIAIGFRMVEVMQAWLQNDTLNTAWFPLEVLEIWPQIARDVFGSAAPEEQALHCHLIVLSADPQATNGMGPTTYVHILESPNFQVVQIRVNKVAAIGSGNFIEKYKDSLKELSDNHEQNFSMMKMETNNPGGMGAHLGFRITHLIKRTNPTGISSHLHYCWVYLGRTIIRTNDHFTIGPWTALDGGSGINQLDGTGDSPAFIPPAIQEGTHFKMPRIAQSWGELERILRSSGARAEGSIA